MTRVAFLMAWMDVGGAERFALDALAQLRQRDVSSTVITTVPSEHRWLTQFEALTLDTVQLDREFVLRRPAALIRQLRAFSPDAILVSNSLYAYDLLPLLRRCFPRTPILDYCHAEQLEWRGGGYPMMSIRNREVLDRTLCASDHLRRWMVDRGADASAVEVVRCNVNTEYWDPGQVDRGRVRESFGYGADDIVIVMVARLDDNKRPLVALDAITAAVASAASRGNERPSVRALFVGTGPEEPALRSRAAQILSVPTEVKSGGPSYVRDVYAAADIVILTSRSEGISLAVYEAMAMGVPVVASDVGGHRELLTADTGRLVALGADDHDDIVRFAAALEPLLADVALRRRLGAAARARVTGGFTLSDMGDGLHRALAIKPWRRRTSRRQAVTSWTRATGHEVVRLLRVRVPRAAPTLQPTPPKQRLGQ